MPLQNKNHTLVLVGKREEYTVPFRTHREVLGFLLVVDSAFWSKHNFVTGATITENPKHYTYCRLSVSLGHSVNVISFYLQMMITQEFSMDLKFVDWNE